MLAQNVLRHRELNSNLDGASIACYTMPEQYQEQLGLLGMLSAEFR